MCVFVCTHIGTLWIYLSMTIFCRTTSQAQITIKPIEMTEQQEQQQNWRGYPAAFTYVFRLILLLLLFLLLRWHYRRLVSVRSLSPSFSRSALCFSLSFEWRYTFFRYQIIFFCVCVIHRRADLSCHLECFVANIMLLCSHFGYWISAGVTIVTSMLSVWQWWVQIQKYKLLHSHKLTNCVIFIRLY